MFWKLQIALVGAVCLVAAPNVRADDPTIEDIAKALQEWKSSWVTLRVRYERRNPGQLRNYSEDPKVREAESLEDYYFEEEWILTDLGSKRHILRDFAAGVLNRTELFAQDASKSVSFDASYRPGEDRPQKLVRLRLNHWNPKVAGSSDAFIQFGSAFPLMPLYNVARQEWLGDTLARGLGQLHGFEEIDGVRCTKVSIRNCNFWFDPRRDYLPCRLDCEDDQGLGILWNVSELVRDENGIWFPKRGTYWFKGDPEEETTSWVVTDVALNETLASATFAPPEPEIGTRVEDKRTGQYYTHGKQRNGRTERELARHAERSLPADAVTAEFPFWNRYRWPLVLLIVAGAVLGAGIWLSRR